jgi:tetratricopeptide (TPR) repeat protein
MQQLGPCHPSSLTSVFPMARGLTLLAATIVGDPASAIGPETDPALTPSDDTRGDDRSRPRRSERKFQEGFRAAHQLIEQQQFEAGIAALRALRRDAHPDVANDLGYASRKLGRYEDAKFWYETALAADPRHARTWSYYGMWHAEQGNVLKALDYLERVRLLCGSDCREYLELKEVIDGTRTY